MEDKIKPLFQPNAKQHLNHSEHLLAAKSNPEIFTLLSGHEQKICTATTVAVRIYCDSKTSTFMEQPNDCLNTWVEPSDEPAHQSLVRAMARQLDRAAEPEAQNQSLHDMAVEIAGDVARQATASNILHAHQSGIKINPAYDAMLKYLASKDGALLEVEHEASGDYHKLSPDAQQQTRESIKSGSDVPFDFEPLLDKSLDTIKAMSDPVMALSHDLPDNSPGNLLAAAEIISGHSNEHPEILRSMSVVHAFAGDDMLGPNAEHIKLQAVARMIGISKDSEQHDHQVTEEMAARTILSDIRVMHSAELRLRGSKENTPNDRVNNMMAQGDYQEVPEHIRTTVFRTIDLGSNIAPEEKIEIHARCEYERGPAKEQNLARHLAEQRASIEF